jgi:excisionase family DNA binding protein
MDGYDAVRTSKDVMRELSEADLYDYTQMCAGKYGPQWTAIRKLVQEVRTLRRDLLATKPAGSIRNNDLDAVLLSSSELHRALTSLVSKLRPIPIAQEPHPATHLSPAVPALAVSATVPRKLFSIKEVAATMGVGRTTAYRLIQSGQLTSVRVGSRVSVRPEAIDDFLGSVSTQSENRKY